MDWKFNFGLFIGITLAGIGFIVGASNWIGIGLIILAFIWGAGQYDDSLLIRVGDA